MDGYATHLPLLVKCVSMTTGPVLEFGCGDYSTRILHEICFNRKLVSLETNRQWFDSYRKMSSRNHFLMLGNSYEDFDDLVRGENWDVVLIDHDAQYGRRGIDLAKVHHAGFVVCHDAENERHGYAEQWAKYKYVYVSHDLFPPTAVVSDTKDFEALAGVTT